jgi:osmoprotectant transport system substrate-binding protein
MRTPPIVFAAATAGMLLLAACGAPGSGGGVAATTAPSASGAASCAPIAGSQLVVLKDDKGLQNADNVIPAVNAAAATADTGLIPLLDAVSASLDTTKLIALNKSVDVDRKTSSEVAATYVQSAGLTAKSSTAGTGKHVIIGAANFSESATLSEVYAAVLRSAGYTADVQTIGNRETYLPALESGQITATPEYAATLAEFLNTKINGANAKPVASSDVKSTVTALTGLGQKVGLAFGTVSAAQDENAFAVTTAFAQAHHVTTLSGLAAACGSLVLAGPAECPQRPYCQPGLESTYGLTFSDFKSYDFGLIGDAVRHGEAAIGLVLSSDGTLGS